MLCFEETVNDGVGRTMSGQADLGDSVNCF